MDILYFEDNQILNYLIKQKLEEEGYQAYSALSCQEALQWLEEGHQPAIALLDIVDDERVFHGEVIPRDPEAGFKIADKVKSIDPNIPILFFSGYGNDEEISRKVREQYRTADFYDKGAVDTHEVNETALHQIIDKINKLLDSQRRQSPLESYFASAFGSKIGIETREETGDGEEKRRIHILDIFDISLIQTRNEPQLDITEMKAGGLNNKELAKVLDRELKERIKLLRKVGKDEGAKEAFDRAANQNKWLPEQERKHAAHLKYTNQCLLFLFKKPEGFFRLSEGTDWLDEFIDSSLNFIIEKSKKYWSPAEKELYRERRAAILEKLNKRIGGSSSLDPITHTEAKRWPGELPNPIFYVESPSLESRREACIQLYRTISRQFLEVFDRNGERNEISNVNLTDFEAQVRTLCDVQGLAYPFLRLNSCIINPGHVRSFTEGRISFGPGIEAVIRNTDYQELRKGFPTLRT